MISNSALRVVENNSQASKDFTIQASGKMFHMVISGLYSNKPQSITREIWSNAFDAHAMVGKEDVPFLVTFPTSLSPTFSCRDFGPGIAHEDMEGFYTVLGHSTKENTNKAVGKWGVGRMSPMSYTDTFSVVSYHKGKASYYSVQLGPDGSPQLHVLSAKVDTDEPDGLQVSFPVKRHDITAFAVAAEVVSYGFKVPPTVTNSKEKVFQNVKKTFEGPGYYLYDDNRLNGAYAQMGCVLYPIPREHLSRTLNIVYQFDIGDLEVTASREALSFGPKDPTAAAIKAKSEVVERDLWDRMQEQVDAQDHIFKAARMATKLRRNLPYNSPHFTYKKQTIPKYWDLSKFDKVSIAVGYMSYRQKSAGWTLEDKIVVEQDYSLYIQDTSDVKANARAATRIGATLDSYKYYVWVRANLKDADQKAQVDAMVKELCFDTKYVKDIPDPGPSTRAKAKVKVSLLVNGKREPYDMDDAEFNAGGYCLKMSNNDYESIYNILSSLVQQKLGGKGIYLIPKTLWKKFDANSKWKPLEPAIRDAIRSEHPKVLTTLSPRYNSYPLLPLAAFKDVGGQVGDFATKVVTAKPISYLGVDYSLWNRFFLWVGLAEMNNKAAEKEYNELLDKYPLLGTYENNRKMYGDYCTYIKAMDNLAKGSN